MLLDIFGISYYLQLSANQNGSGFDVRIVDEAFCRVSLIETAENSSKVSDLLELYSGMQLDDEQKFEIAQYCWRAADVAEWNDSDSGHVPSLIFAT